MVICEAQLRCIFRDYNDIYFDSQLPLPNFKVIHSFKYFGYFKSDVCYDGRLIDPTIEISDCYEYSSEQLRDIMVHEMIHYFLAYTGRDVKGSHGSEFHSVASRLNEQYKLNITARINEDEYTRRKGSNIFKYALSKLF